MRDQETVRLAVRKPQRRRHLPAARCSAAPPRRRSNRDSAAPAQRRPAFAPADLAKSASTGRLAGREKRSRRDKTYVFLAIAEGNLGRGVWFRGSHQTVN